MTESNIFEVDISTTGVTDAVLTIVSGLVSRDSDDDGSWLDNVKIEEVKEIVVSSNTSFEFGVNVVESEEWTISKVVRSSADSFDFDDEE